MLQHAGILVIEAGRKKNQYNFASALGSEPKLLVGVQFDLITYGLRSMKEDVLLTTDKNLIIFSIDYDLVEQKVFWMDLNAESIKWLNMRNNQRGTLMKGGSWWGPWVALAAIPYLE